MPQALVVDDQPVNRQYLAYQLAQLGLRVHTAERALEALVFWRHNSVAVIITDCHLSGVDGFGFARAIRDEESSGNRPRTPIVGWTARNALVEAGRCSAAGMDDLLLKPASLAALMIVLGRWLPHHGFAPPGAGAINVPDRSLSLDRSALAGLSGNPADQRRRITEYLAQTSTHLEALGKALKASDLAAIAGVVESIKGDSQRIGALEVAAVSELMAAAAAGGDRAAIAAEHDPLVEALQRLEQYITTRTPGR
jgi:two-component system, NarL family, sensor histidine kinase EvgS